MEGLDGFTLKKLLSEKYNVPVFMENITKLSALGEKRFGAGRTCHDLVFLEISTGVGAGILIQDELHRGCCGAAGEVGFSIAGKENINYPMGNKGFFEKNASIDGIAERASQRLNSGEHSAVLKFAADSSQVTADAVCRAALNGDGLALSVIEDTVKMYTVLLQNIILILNPEIILIGGDICNLPEIEGLFLQPLRNHLKNILPFNPPKIIEASLGRDAGIIGACFMATESLLLGMYPYRIEKI